MPLLAGSGCARCDWRISSRRDLKFVVLARTTMYKRARWCFLPSLKEVLTRSMLVMETFQKMINAIVVVGKRPPADRFMYVWSMFLAAAQVFLFVSGIAQETIYSLATVLELVSFGAWAYFCFQSTSGKQQKLAAGQVLWMLAVGSTHKVAHTHGISVEALFSLLMSQQQGNKKRKFRLFGRKQRLPEVSLSAFLQGHVWWNTALSIVLATTITLVATKLYPQSRNDADDKCSSTIGTDEPLPQIQEEAEEVHNDKVQRAVEDYEGELLEGEALVELEDQGRATSNTFATEATEMENDTGNAASQERQEEQHEYQEEYSDEEEEDEDLSACYLVYEADSSGRLVEIYSRQPIENAIGMWIPGPGHSLPDFKFT
eukprot:scaffold818_cov136-Cylindrotheca_fusiformis.AAC.58